MYVDDIVLVVDSGMELQTMLEVVQVYVMRWRMTFNSRKQDYGSWEERRWNELENW